MIKYIFFWVAAFVFFGSGCANVKVEPLEVKPIHIVVDVNVRIDKELEDFFSDIDKKGGIK
jgi:hypothetical protein